jgi:hypothetical protein
MASAGNAMTLKTSLLIQGDSASAVKAVSDLSRTVDGLGDAGKRAAPGLQAVDRAQEEAADSARILGAAQAAAATEMAALATGATRIGRNLGDVVGGAQKATGAVLANTDVVRKHTKAINDNDQEMKRHAAGARNLGQQFGDLAIMIQGGIDPVRAFATQAGQMGYAASEMGGVVGKVGGVLTSFGGIAFTVAVSALAPLAMELLSSKDAADELATSLSNAADRSDAFGNAQSLISKAIDVATGKLKTHNLELRETIRLQAEAGLLAAQKAERDARDAINNVGQPSFKDRVSQAYAGIGSTTAGSPNVGGALAVQRSALTASAPLRALAREVLTGDMDATEIRKRVDTMAAAGQLAGRSAEQIIELKNQLYDLPRALNDKRANQAALDALDGKGVAAELKPYERAKKPPKPKKPASTEALGEFGRDASTTIAGILNQFDGTPSIVKQVNAEVAKLDDLIEDLGRRKPDGFEKLIANAREAKGVVQAGINKPLDDFLSAQREQLEQGALIAQGRELEAQALAAIVAIERLRPPLSAQQRAEVVASIEALRQQERALERIRAVQQINLSAVRDIQQIVTQTIYEGPKSLKDMPGRIFESFRRYSAEKITEALFGDIFRDMRDQATGAQKVDAASVTLVGAFGEVTASARQLSGALAQAAAPPSARGAAEAGDLPSGTEIVVEGRRSSAQRGHGEVYGDTVAKILNKVGIGKDIAQDIGRFTGKAFAGALEGQTAAGFAGLLGAKTSNTGAAIGGAVGSFLPIPGGSIIGGLLGGLAGGLFKKTAKGSAGISIADGDASAGAATGSSAKTRGAAATLADAVAGGISDIAARLGATIGGSTNVQIGTYKDKLRVSTNGTPIGGKGSSGAITFQSEADAISYAIRDAINDGVFTGLSAAVTRALQSNSNVDKAVAEALKVQEVEGLMGGILGQYRKAFTEFEATAKERMRIASQYGFNVVEIEKRNAADRAKLAEQLAAAQVGSLQNLVNELTAGSLFEGSALDKITAINAAIAKAKADFDAGVEGAGDQLAGLYEQRLAASKAAYGTTAGFAADRTSTISEAQAAIARVNAQITAAKSPATTDPALQTTNAALDENNDQNARIISQLELQTAAIARLSGGSSGGGFNLAKLAAV